MSQLFAGLFVEGTTDISFLSSIVERTLQNVAFDCKGEIDLEVKEIKIDKSGLGFCEQVIMASEKGFSEFGITILCVHSDADNKKLEDTYQNRINQAIDRLKLLEANQYCKILVAIVPIQETEAWMLADKELLKNEIGTEKSDNDLEINRQPESIARPKEVIENAIRIARENYTRKRRKDLTIGDLYLPVGQAMSLDKLEKLESYRDFKNNVKEAFKTLNLLQ
jgi:hypothetical protein